MLYELVDDGGVQGEVPSRSKSVIVMRDANERSEGIKAGTLKLASTDGNVIYDKLKLLFKSKETYNAMVCAGNLYGDGFTCRRIADVLEKSLK